MQVFISKLITYCVKFAGVVHLIRNFTRSNADESTIELSSVLHAINLTNFYAGQVSQMIQLYSSEKEERTPEQIRVIQALNELYGEVKNGRLPLSRVREVYNCGLREIQRISKGQSKRLVTLLSQVGLSTIKGTDNLSFVIVES